MDYVLYELSYKNMTLLSASIPSFSDKKTEKTEDVINADDPENQELIKKMLFS